MELFIHYSILAAATWLISMALITRTETFAAAVIFKVIPMALGLSCLFDGLKLIGWI